MSNIYIQEPPTKGKVLLITSVGDIDIELWSKEAPKACRNFVQLCMEGYYDGTIFHRVVKDFIVQGGDPTGTGAEGESIYGEPFKDEFHSRLRFIRRGLVAMANSGPNDNGSQFFFTMNQTPELQNKHTIFGKVTGPTLFNMLKLQEVEIDRNERPLYPHTILRTEILSNPFEDIIPRAIKKAKKDKEEDKKTKSKSKATKNFSLLSFGEEAEEDEEQEYKAIKKFIGKSKSSHDLTDDPHLSSVPVLDTSDSEKTTGRRKIQDDENPVNDGQIDEIRKKLTKDNLDEAPTKDKEVKEETPEDVKKSKSEETKKEVLRLQREIKASKKRAEKKGKEEIKSPEKEEAEKPSKPEQKDGGTDILEAFKIERQRFKDLKKMQKRKGESREAQTLELLKKFQSKLTSMKQLSIDYPDSEGEDDTTNEEELGDSSWMRKKLKFDDTGAKKVIDANIPDTDRYEIHDPRNPLTQRRREASKKKIKKK